MNERIKELIEQATTQKQIVAGDEFQLAMSVEFFDKEKFAELIVGECTRIVVNNGIATATHDQMVRQDCVNDIKRHFGVKE